MLSIRLRQRWMPKTSTSGLFGEQVFGKVRAGEAGDPGDRALFMKSFLRRCS